MADTDTLLARLAPWLTSRTEEVAVAALGHLFDDSPEAREGLDDVVRSGVRNVNPVARVRTQVSGGDGTRPDLVGFDEGGAERVLVEVKFWAALTPRQPVAYLDRLPDDGPAVLLFVAPDERIHTLWPELRSRAERDGMTLVHVPAERTCARVSDTQRHLLVAGWTGLLDRIAARTARDPDVGADIRQLRGLADRVDEGRFRPLRNRGEDFGPDSRRMLEMKRIIDVATERGVANGWASRKGLNRTPRPHGYGRYLRLAGSRDLWFGVNRDLWERDGQTPLWLHCPHFSEAVLKEIGRRLETGRDDCWIPIVLREDTEEERDALEGVVSTLRSVAEIIEEARDR